MARLRSFMYIKKSNRSGTDPSGSLKVRADIFELKLLIETDGFWSVTYDSNYLFDIPLVP